MLRFALACLTGLALAAPVTSQCTAFAGGCSIPPQPVAQLGCSGLPNICCPNFSIVARGLDTSAGATIAMFSTCNSRALLPVPPACVANCVLYNTVIASLVRTPDAQGSDTIPMPVPCDPNIVGAAFCVQYAQAHAPGGSLCFTVSNAVQVRVGPQGGC